MFTSPLLNREISLWNLQIIQLDVRQSILDLSLYIHINSLFLIDVSVPNLDCQFFVCNLFLIAYEMHISFWNDIKIFDHFVKHLDFLFDHTFILRNEKWVSILELLDFLIRDLLKYLWLNVLFRFADFNNLGIDFLNLLK